MAAQSRRRQPSAQIFERHAQEGRAIPSNLLGKRVDYSGRSVIVIGPELKLNQSACPRRWRLSSRAFHHPTPQGAGRPYRAQREEIIERQTPEVWDILDEVTKDMRFLNRLRPCIAFRSGFRTAIDRRRSIRIHPLVYGLQCGLRWRSDGRPRPLSVEAKMEARMLMLAPITFLAVERQTDYHAFAESAYCYYLTQNPRVKR
jgi:DNA-directed RNA polymerase subunit beta'